MFGHDSWDFHVHLFICREHICLFYRHCLDPFIVLVYSLIRFLLIFLFWTSFKRIFLSIVRNKSFENKKYREQEWFLEASIWIRMTSLGYPAKRRQIQMGSALSRHFSFEDLFSVVNGVRSTLLFRSDIENATEVSLDWFI